jgi:phosphoribosylaminoimidazolecarboxamide formyltransferase / IMP cyclohydrolase
LIERTKISRALISVSDKTGLIELASALSSAGVKLVSTGSTAKQIAAAGLEVTEVSEVTGFPESLDGRVKTLHPSIHGGILADFRLEDHRHQLSDLGIEAFELVVVNLYPFVESIKSGARGKDAIEQIDIGGPAMVRAAAKNHDNVAIVVSPEFYPQLIGEIEAGGTTLEFRRQLAVAAFSHTANYDSAVSSHLASEFRVEQKELALGFTKQAELRYGENAHQQASIYASGFESGIATATQLGGKEMSYNNYVDADAALRAAHDFDTPAVAIIKHANPCGIATDPDIAKAYQNAHLTDPVSAFGGVIASNRVVTKEFAQAVVEVFTEVIVAPGFEPEAIEILKSKKNLRLLALNEGYQLPTKEFRQVSGGVLIQQPDNFANLDVSSWELVSGKPASESQLADLKFAWIASRAVKSNAILLAKDQAAVGIGMGQVNRLDSCRLAVSRAGDRVTGSVAASDAFFPFADGLQVLIDAGVSAVVQPGGSMRDAEVIEAAQAAGITMYFTSERHFFH